MSGVIGSEQSSTIKIVSDLNVIGTLSVGKTLSASSMAIVDHNSWTGALWRTYSRENRTTTMAKIEEILNDAVFALETNYSIELASALDKALLGFETLTETYKGDYYTFGKVRQIIEKIRLRMAPVDDVTVEQYITDVVQQQIEIIAQEVVQEIIAQEVVQETLAQEVVQETVAQEVVQETLAQGMEQVESVIRIPEQPFRIVEPAPGSESQRLYSGQDSESELPSNVAEPISELPSNVAEPIETPKISESTDEFGVAPLVKTSDRTRNQRTDKNAVFGPNAGRSPKSTADMSGNNTSRINKNFKAAWENRSQRREHKTADAETLKK